MRVLAIIVIAVLLSGCGHIARNITEPFTPTEWALMGMNAGAMAGDWYTTSRLEENGNYERNPILGMYSDQHEIDAYFAASWLLQLVAVRMMWLLQLVAVRMMPHDWRVAVLGTSTTISAGLAIANRRINR